jgi:adenosylmethionine-8-amino-7-oxononanoate aminotransferase
MKRGVQIFYTLRNPGLVAGIGFESRPDNPAARGYKNLVKCFRKNGFLIHITADTINLSPPLIVERSRIGQTCDVIGETLAEVARYGGDNQRSERTDPSKELGQCG